jgi:hypothetical protein
MTIGLRGAGTRPCEKLIKSWLPARLPRKVFGLDICGFRKAGQAPESLVLPDFRAGPVRGELDLAVWQCGGQGFESPQLHLSSTRICWPRATRKIISDPFGSHFGSHRAL